MSTIQLQLPDDLRERLDSRVASGDFANAQDYLLSLLRHDLEWTPEPDVEQLLAERSRATSREMTPAVFNDIRSRLANWLREKAS